MRDTSVFLPEILVLSAAALLDQSGICTLFLVGYYICQICAYYLSPHRSKPNAPRSTPLFGAHLTEATAPSTEEATAPSSEDTTLLSTPDSASKSQHLQSEPILNPEEEIALQHFRARLVQLDLLYDDNCNDNQTLLRFLRGRQGNVDDATDMYARHMEWRSSFGVDDVFNQYFPEKSKVAEAHPTFFHKTSRAGNPVQIIQFGKSNYHKLKESVTAERLLQIWVQEMETNIRVRWPACARLSGRAIHSNFLIIDLDGLSAKHLGSEPREYFKKAGDVIKDNYPEVVAEIILINVPKFAFSIWNVFKYTLPSETRKKIHVCSADYSEELLMYVDASSLPASLFSCGEDQTFERLSEQGCWVVGKPLDELSTTDSTCSMSASEEVGEEIDEGKIGEEPERNLPDANTKSLGTPGRARGRFGALSKIVKSLKKWNFNVARSGKKRARTTSVNPTLPAGGGGNLVE